VFTLFSRFVLDESAVAAPCRAFSRYALGLAAIVAASVPKSALAQSPDSTAQLPDIVVTADRVAESIERTGSAITVVHGADIAASSPVSLVDALRSVPGLDISETGGPAGTASVRLRGANANQTLVMIDGVRVNDPAAASGDYDFSMVPVGTIERIEVLRGPQSALYGSDAVGGVINIITRKGKGPARLDLQTEAGSYGTVSTSGSLTGSQGPWSYAASGTGQRSDGFSRYGYRIPAIEARYPNLESDGFDRWAGSARLGYDAGDGRRFEVGAIGSRTRADYDAASGTFPDTPSEATRKFGQAWARAAVDTGAVTHSLNVFANRSERAFDETTYKTNMLPRNTTRTLTDYVGDRYGGEYQADIGMGILGSLIVGARGEQETADVSSERLLPTPLPRTSSVAGEQTTRSLFSLWRLPIGERMTVTLGGRVDDVADVDRFETWRTTIAYTIPETGTKLRASAGTGGKAPTLYQLYAPTYGNTSLKSEESFGWDAGVDQRLFGDRVTLSLTGFGNDLTNLIDYDSVAMRYFNVARAETSGLEVGADAVVWPNWVKLKLAYTYLHAIDADTGLTLQRRPEHAGRVSLAVTPMADWLIEPRLYLVSERYSSAGEKNRLDPYARLDIYSSYRLDEHRRVFLRLENITDVHYQEVLNYGTAGLSAYAGFNLTW
jgi:vitamin B12 transporter